MPVRTEQPTQTVIVIEEATYGEAFVTFGNWLKENPDYFPGYPNTIELNTFHVDGAEDTYGIRFIIGETK